uniref:hypothetical protein n=1 Tax=Prevotella sp. TaxID=59823 RepID=UPI0040292D9B
MDTEKLNALKEQAHKTAVEHGFHEDVKPDVFYLGLVMSEAGEAINADRKGLHADTKAFEEDEANGLPFADNFKKHIKDSVEDEIADIVIRLLDFAGLKEYELSISPRCVQIDSVFLRGLKNCGLSGVLFQLMWALSDALDENCTGQCIIALLSVFSDCFGMFTGCEKDLWWFVEKKMRFNKQRPMLNGKKY